jgi:hypothetical protein
LAGAIEASLPQALIRAIQSWSGPAVLRIRRLEVDVTMDCMFEAEAFVSLVAHQIVKALNRVLEEGSATRDAGVAAYPTRAAYLAALIEALAAGKAADCWWLRDAGGLRFLSRSAAIRTALLADPVLGRETLESLPPARRGALLAVLGSTDAERILDGIAARPESATAEECIAAVAAAASEFETFASPLALYLCAAAARPRTAGPTLAFIARLWIKAKGLLEEGSAGESASLLPALARGVDNAPGPLAALPETARTAFSSSLAQQGTVAASSAVVRQGIHLFSRFGGLLLLLPGLGFEEMNAAAAAWPAALPQNTAALIAYAALGLCAGRANFADWLKEPVWRELFGLEDITSSGAIAARLSALTDREWESLSSLGSPLTLQDARFLVLPRHLAGSRAAARGLARLARALSARFARRLPGFGAASAPFLWANLLGSGAALESRREGWEARLIPPPLDVLLSLSRIAEGDIMMPSGIRVRIARVPP